jgi:DNA invertase Pin-like site-specific DNA recombinase
MPNQKNVCLYARVSTDKQTVDLQLDKLRDYAQKRGLVIVQEYIDHATGQNVRRPAFTQMMEDARRRKFDALLVWKLDRLGRSLKDLINTLSEFENLGIDFIAYDNQLDTSSSTGKLLFYVIGAMAEFERDIIRDRVKAGLETAKRKGKRLGRRPTPDDQVQKIRQLKKEGHSNRAIAKRLKISEGTVRNKISNG